MGQVTAIKLQLIYVLVTKATVLAKIFSFFTYFLQCYFSFSHSNIGHIPMLSTYS